MSDLLAVADLQNFLSLSIDTDRDVLTAIADGVESQFLAETNRRGRPFQTATTGRAEVHDARASSELYLDYPIAALTSVVLGLDTSDADETLDVSDATVLQYQIGTRRLVRVDGGFFGPWPWGLSTPRPFIAPAPPATRTSERHLPNYVHVTYDTMADVPALATLALMRACATIYRQMGSEDATTERVSTYSRTMAKVYTDDPLWARAVLACREPHV